MKELEISNSLFGNIKHIDEERQIKDIGEQC